VVLGSTIGVVMIVFLPLKLVQAFLLRLNHDHPGLIMGYQPFYASLGGGYLASYPEEMSLGTRLVATDVTARFLSCHALRYWYF